MPRASTSTNGFSSSGWALLADSTRLCKYFVLALLLTACPSGAQESQPVPAIRVNVERVNVSVAVTDAAGNFIEGLRREDFRVFDNNVEQPITDFLPVEEPAQILLL